MIKNLSIKNFIIIESEIIDFSSGLNIITGETGSGKSIIIDALTILLGNRASIDTVKKGATKAVLEAVFCFPVSHPIHDAINEFELDSFGEDIIIRREVSARGGSRSFINDSPVSLNQIRDISPYLADFHGQHDNRILLDKTSHVEILDKSGNYRTELDDYSSVYEKAVKTMHDLKCLLKKEREMKERIDFLRFKKQEIDKVNPLENEDEEIEDDLKILENSEFLKMQTALTYSKLYDEENSIYSSLAEIKSVLEQLSAIDSKFQQYVEEIKSASIAAKEIASFARDYSENIDLSSDHMNTLRKRLAEINSIKKKYGSIEEILMLNRELSDELKQMDNFDEDVKHLKSQLAGLRKELGEAGSKLLVARKSHSEKFTREINESLLSLGINYPQFEVRFSQRALRETDETALYAVCEGKPFESHPYGIANVEFFISTNQGQPVMPIAEVASGGEISRIMLSIKSISSNRQAMPLMIFDEIDNGISGRVARKMGIKLKEMAATHQIISITHLPQIAALGDKNFRVNKTESSAGAVSTVSHISQQEKLLEIAKLLSGEQITEASLNSARELIENTSF